MKRSRSIALLTTLVLLGSAAAHAGAHEGKGEGHRKMGQYSGFEGNEAELGAAVAAAIAAASPTQGPEHDFSGREENLGLAVAAAIKIMNASAGYQHEMNDALVKMTLNFIQFAKDQDLVDEMITEEIATGIPMMTRVRKLIEKTGQPGTGADRGHRADRLLLPARPGNAARTGQDHLQVTVRHRAGVDDPARHARPDRAGNPRDLDGPAHQGRRRTDGSGPAGQRMARRRHDHDQPAGIARRRSQLTVRPAADPTQINKGLPRGRPLEPVQERALHGIWTAVQSLIPAVRRHAHPDCQVAITLTSL